jgi:hypothetical protein
MHSFENSFVLCSDSAFPPGLVEYPCTHPHIYTLGCEPTTDEDVVYIEVEEVIQEQAPAKNEDGVDYYLDYHQEDSDV